MFGFLASCQRDLDYRSLYARCCQHQHLRYGTLSLPTLSYESVFLYAFALDAGAAGDYKPPSQSCCMLLGKQGANDAPDSALGEFATSLGMLLTSVKLDDDVRDSRSWLVRTWKGIHRRVLTAPIAKANAYFSGLDPNFRRRIESLATAQSQLELCREPDLAEYVRPTSEAFGYLFSLMAIVPSLSAFANPLREVGLHVGASMIALDCAMDWRTDKRHALHNPVENVEQAVEAFRFSRQEVAATRRLCQVIFSKGSRTVSILSNVEQRVGQCLRTDDHADAPDPRIGKEPPGVVLNAVCCVPCGDAVIGVDSKDCDKCGTTCCLACCLAACCFPGICG